MADKESSSTDDQRANNDPFFVHHSDNPTAVLVSPLLTGDNYSTWLRAMTMALRAKNKLCFVDGTTEPPTDIKELQQWQRCNDLVSSWILNSTEGEIRASILYAETAREIWLDLSNRFTQTNAPKIYQLKQSIASLKQEDTSASTYFTKMKALWDELNSLTVVKSCTCGHGKASAIQQEQDRAMEFLQGLHDRFSALRSQILLMDPFPNATKIYALVRQEEKQQEIHSLSPSVNAPEAAALSVNPAHASTPNGRPSHSSNRSNNGQRNNGRDNRRNGRPTLHCDYCGYNNHTKEVCYRLHGFPNAQSRTLPRNQNFSGSSSSRPQQSDAQGLVSSPPITQEQYNKILAMLSLDSINGQANLAVFAHNAHIKHKFDQRAKPGVFVGYPYAQKGYRIYDVHSKTIYVSRDVVFHETIFPFHDVVPNPTPSPVIPLPIEDHPRYDCASFPAPTTHSPSPQVQTEHPPILAQQDYVHTAPAEAQTKPPNSSLPEDIPQAILPTSVIRSTRERRPPSYLQDYNCSAVTPVALPHPTASTQAGILYPLEHVEYHSDTEDPDSMRGYTGKLFPPHKTTRFDTFSSIQYPIRGADNDSLSLIHQSPCICTFA
ncbi:hypothetical protein MRB53_017808 [Persea americana]|uniref:Uncharacterized protein n=1 Tax=Persea americana TaxID=3435 RepID=A0ACC2M715_PERAE|nr:hypothetical protein MRB53_017808 [Persea americana]